MSTESKTIEIQYFALLREERGLSRESYKTEAGSAQELFDELNQKFHFSLDTSRLRISINDRFERWDQVLNDRDSVVFIPPVAGG